MADAHASQAPLTWGISTLAKPELDLPGWFELARRWNFAEIELRNLEGSLDVPARLAAQFVEPAKLGQWCRAREVQVGVVSASLQLAVDHPGRRDELLALAPWAEAAGARWLRVFDAVGAYRPWSAEEWTVARRQLQWWREQRAAHRWEVDLIVEAHQAWFVPQHYHESARHLGEELPLIFDLGHAMRGHGSATAALAAFTELAPWTLRVHFKDVSPAGRPGPRHCVPGEGIAPLADFLALCRQQPQPPVVTFEWERLWEPALPDLELALSALQAHFRDEVPR